MFKNKFNSVKKIKIISKINKKKSFYNFFMNCDSLQSDFNKRLKAHLSLHKLKNTLSVGE